MKRRDFLAGSLTAGWALATSQPASAESARGSKQLLELRTYHFETEAKKEVFDSFLASAAVPALNRAGIRPVGVFELRGDDNPGLAAESKPPRLYVLLPHESAESVVRMLGLLAADAELSASGGVVLEAPKSNPAYVRYESSLFLAFDGMPRVEVPSRAPDRVLQLRIYESHNTERALKKIEMFNEGGEIEIFRRCGMPPVFFGQALIGSRLPNLTYMLSFRDKEAMAKGWDRFRADPDWAALRSDQAYKDTVSNITNRVLRPAASSQI